MKKLLLTTLLTIFSTGAMAEWTLIDGVDGNFESDMYYDKASINRSSNIARIVTLNDFKSLQDQNFGKFLSLIEHAEYDCTKK
jgi:hypothetical protein